MTDHQGRAAGIVLAGGRGARAGFSTNKAYLPIDGAPMISHSLLTLARSPWVERLVLVIRPEDRKKAERAVAGLGLTTATLLVDGGRSRHQSEERGLEAISDDINSGAIDLVAIHDGARPFLDSDLLERLFRHAHHHGGATPTLAMETPIFEVSDRGELASVDQNRLHRAQTPQVFRAPELWAAYRKARQAKFEGVDTAETTERFSDLKNRATAGDTNNRKLTYRQDFDNPPE